MHENPVGNANDPFHGQGSTSSSPIKGKFNRPIKAEELIVSIEVSLEDLYNGTSKKVDVILNLLCSICRGQGSRSGALEKCSGCGGSGIGRIDKDQIDLNKTMETYVPCDKCKGFGETVSPGDHCPNCKGQQVLKTMKTFYFTVVKGLQDGAKTIRSGEGNEAPGSERGDIAFVLKQKEHPMFKCIGNDLMTEYKLSLMEALTGFRFVLTHLDNRKLIIKSNPGEVIKPGQFKAVVNEGMVIYLSQPCAKGKLYIHFRVEFPDAMQPDQCLALQKFLPTSSTYRNLFVDSENCEETTLESVGFEEVKAILRSCFYSAYIRETARSSTAF